MPHYDLLTIVNDQQWGCFSIFRRADDVTRTMSKGGVLVNVFTPPSGNPVSAPVFHLYSSDPPPPHLDGWLRARQSIVSIQRRTPLSKYPGCARTNPQATMKSPPLAIYQD